MWQDMEHGRPTEIEAMNGFVAKRAEELGLEAPVNDLLASLIRASERK
jgi:2-dehydropantoate 2-reductase